jgi:hypothetical protein
MSWVLSMSINGAGAESLTHCHCKDLTDGLGMTLAARLGPACLTEFSRAYNDSDTKHDQLELALVNVIHLSLRP